MKVMASRNLGYTTNLLVYIFIWCVHKTVSKTGHKEEDEDCRRKRKKIIK